MVSLLSLSAHNLVQPRAHGIGEDAGEPAGNYGALRSPVLRLPTEAVLRDGSRTEEREERNGHRGRDRRVVAAGVDAPDVGTEERGEQHHEPHRRDRERRPHVSSLEPPRPPRGARGLVRDGCHGVPPPCRPNGPTSGATVDPATPGSPLPGTTVSGGRLRPAAAERRRMPPDPRCGFSAVRVCGWIHLGYGHPRRPGRMRPSSVDGMRRPIPVRRDVAIALLSAWLASWAAEEQALRSAAWDHALTPVEMRHHLDVLKAERESVRALLAPESSSA